MKIRYAKFSDITELSELIKSVVSNTSYYTPNAQKEEIRKHNSEALKQYLKESKYYLCLVALETQNIVGFAIGRNEAGVFWADWIGVHKDFRRKGIAQSLMEDWEKKLRQKRVHKIWCDTRTSNKQSISLLSKLGYRKLGIFKNGWYKQDFILWEKDLARR